MLILGTTKYERLAVCGCILAIVESSPIHMILCVLNASSYKNYSYHNTATMLGFNHLYSVYVKSHAPSLSVLAARRAPDSGNFCIIQFYVFFLGGFNAKVPSNIDFDTYERVS